jgi:pantothenate kinase type III
VKSAVELGGGLISRGLVLYYRHIEKKKGKTGLLDRCKYELLYEFVIRSFTGKEGDGQQVRFIEFSSALKELNEQMESCIANEIKLVEYLADEDKKVELFPDNRLMARH